MRGQRSAPGHAVLTHLPLRPLSTHSSVCLRLPGASGTQTRSQPPGALVQAATPGGLAGLTASPADKGRRRAPGVAGRARRPSEGWAVHVGLGPGLRGKGRAAGRGRGGGRSTQPGSWGAKGCVCVLPMEHSCTGGVDTWDRQASLEAPSHGGGRLRSGGTSQVSPPAPGRAHTALEADRWGQAPGQAVLRGLAPDALCPHRRSCLAPAWGLLTQTSVRVCSRDGVCVGGCVCLFPELFSSRGYNLGIVFSDHKYYVQSQ